MVCIPAVALIMAELQNGIARKATYHLTLALGGAGERACDLEELTKVRSMAVHSES
jgi:hypothetical protein